MKVLLVNGSPHKHGCTYTALEEVAAALEINGIKTEIMHIGTKPISGCLACNTCKRQEDAVLMMSLITSWKKLEILMDMYLVLRYILHLPQE